MEKEEQQSHHPQKKRRVSLFKRRRKSEIRPFVKAQKKREYKKIFMFFMLFLAFIILISALLYLFRVYVVDGLFLKNVEILTPQGSVRADSEQVREIIEERGISFTNYVFATESADITFILNGKTRIIMTANKDLMRQLELVEAIDRQIILDGKQAISIDLRYNKPIVKF